MAIDGHKILNYLYLGREKLVQAILYLVSFMFVRMYLLFLFALNIINWLLAFYINNNVSQNLVVLHYNVNLGVNLIGNARDIYIIPTLGLAFIAINFLLLLNIFKKDKFLIHLLLGFSLLINLFLIAGTVVIYLVNFR
ncbi:hypothetical protein KKA93_02385 [Patescibacteria group bacterium]|nr:hypothetical protein [Patescibacteria group bacterium]MBU1934233.1 hypothetical protein [Patescibacteria group bacterium]MBU2007928.1 hypothetical protein [Patescibacteria group bacterium]MBU2233271.1 hypothetical protein [Patescibacteria group bacterium]MBU2264353.1 hypothetical protein [Patescibacteria group bacterium]